MTQTRFAIVTAVTAVLAVALLGVVYAQPGPPPGAGRGQGPGAGPSPQPPGFQLSDEQRTKVDAIMKEDQDRARTAREQAQKLNEQLRTELFADAPDQAKIKQLRGDLLKAQQELFALRLDHQTRFSQVLTPEQRRMVRDRQAQRRAMRGLRRGFGPGFGPGMGARGFRGRAFGRRGGLMGPMLGPGPGAGFGRPFRRQGAPGLGFGAWWWGGWR